MIFWKILVGIIMAPIALSLIILALVIFGIVKAMEFAYGNIEFVLAEDKSKDGKN